MDPLAISVMSSERKETGTVSGSKVDRGNLSKNRERS